MAKVQEGQGRKGKAMKGHEEIKLLKGCCERTQAWTGVSPQGGGNTKTDLARAMGKALSKMQTVTRDVSVRSLLDGTLDKCCKIGGCKE